MVTFPGSKEQKDKLVAELVVDQEQFNSIMIGWLNNEVDDRFGWALSSVIEAQPTWALPYIGTMLRVLQESPDDATKRNITRALQFVAIPENYQGKVLEICYQLLCSEREKIACRVFSMSVIYNLSVEYPDLQDEFINTLTDLYPFGSAGFKSRAKRFIKKLSK